MKLWLLGAVAFCSGCVAWPYPLQRPSPVAPVVEEVPVRDHSGSDFLVPKRSVDELLVARLDLCQHPAKAASQAEQPAPAADIEAKLDALLLASCRPEATPGLLSQLIADLTKAGTWPKEYAGFFDLLLANQKAYAVVEKMYTDLKTEHEATIQGLGEIEADIELQTKATRE